MLCLALLLACSDAALDSGAASEGPVVWTEPGLPGPYDAGVTTATFVDQRGKELTIEVWYPAWAPEGATPDPYPEIPVEMQAFRNAPAASGPFPLVAFSHGHIAIRYQSAFLTEHLAQHGFVVVSPDHPHDTFLDADESRLWEIVLERPGDIFSSVDEVLRRSAQGDPVLAGVTLADEYAIIGHSLGAVNALVIGGGAPDWEAFAAFCEKSMAAGERYTGCTRIEQMDLSMVPDHDYVDERATVTVSMSPGLWYLFGDSGLHGVRAPLLVAGDQDEILLYETEEYPVFQAMTAPSTLATVHRAGHYSWTDICVILPVWNECDGEKDGYIEVARAQEITRGMVTAWIRGELLGDQEALDWMEAAKAGWTEVGWEQVPEARGG